MDKISIVALLLTLAFNLISWYFISKLLVNKGVEDVPRILLAAAYGLASGYLLFPLVDSLIRGT